MTRLHMPEFGAPENVIAAQERWERRHRVRRAIVYGKATTKEVAAALGLSVKTVRLYVRQAQRDVDAYLNPSPFGLWRLSDVEPPWLYCLRNAHRQKFPRSSIQPRVVARNRKVRAILAQMAALHSSLPRREFLFVSTPGWRAPE
jgi:hypothetical protein